MSQPTDLDAAKHPPRSSSDRRSCGDRRSETRRQAGVPVEEDRRSEQERRQFLRRILGERRTSWPPADKPHRKD